MKNNIDSLEVVKVYVDKFDDLFNMFDRDDISDYLSNYIENRCSRTTKNELEIDIITKEELDKDEKDRVVTSIRSHYGIEKKFLDIEIKKLQKVNIYYFIAGLLIILISNLVTIGTYIPQVIEVLGGFVIYESAFNLLFTDNELDLKCYRAIKIGKAHVKFIVMK